MHRFLVGALVALVFFSASASAEDANDDEVFFIDHPLYLLFVQSATGMRYDGDTLILEDMAPATLFFADRPERLSGHFSNADFVDLWTRSSQSYAADPPNAALSFLEETDKPPVVVELKDVSLQGNDLHYEVRVLDGELPAESGAVSLFIDPWVWVPRGDAEYRHPGWLRCHWNHWGSRVCHRHWW